MSVALAVCCGSVLSVPVRKGEAFGLYQLEALGCGIPLVQPELGAFPEIINSTGGGFIYHPNTAESLAECLREALSDPLKLKAMGIAGREAVEIHYNSRTLAGSMTEVYDYVIAKRKLT